jgi:protease-4
MWGALRRAGLLGLLAAYELILGLAGRRGPYGVLTIELSGDLAEEGGEQRFFGLVRRSTADYLSHLSLLRWARDDAHLAGVLIRTGGLDAGWARLQGLRRAIQGLRAAGKRVWVHLDHAGIHEYYLASAAERISLAPAAALDIAGLSSEAVFLLDTLRKIGVEADIVQMGRYKSAAESFTRRDMSPSHREMIESLVDDLYGQLVDGISGGRNMEPAQVRRLVDRGPFVAREALEANLVDALCHGDEAESSLVEAAGGAPAIERGAYARRRGAEVRRQALRAARGALGLLHVGGTIKGGESIPGPQGARAVGSATVRAALKELRERDDIRAVVVRVASPGGSGTASDSIWREIFRTRESKPVVVSLGDVAASGGYYVALAGGPVFAEAGTITGSIGVIAGKANLRGLYDRVGVTKEMVSRGRHAAIFSDYAPLDDESRERIRVEAETFYRDFVEKVADARRLSGEAAEAAAEGRVFTGRQAWTRGLVDELGGLEEAIAAAKSLIGVSAEESIAIERYPRARRLWKFSVDLNLPAQGSLAELLGGLTGLRFIWRDRVWAVLPFDLRFF